MPRPLEGAGALMKKGPRSTEKLEIKNVISFNYRSHSTWSENDRENKGLFRTGNAFKYEEKIISEKKNIMN